MQFFWFYADIALGQFTIHSLVFAIVASQFCILQVYLLAKSQASIPKELSETVRILSSFNSKVFREINVELEILMLKILHGNSNDRTSRMFSLDYPFIYGVRWPWLRNKFKPYLLLFIICRWRKLISITAWCLCSFISHSRYREETNEIYKFSNLIVEIQKLSNTCQFVKLKKFKGLLFFFLQRLKLKLLNNLNFHRRGGVQNLIFRWNN